MQDLSIEKFNMLKPLSPAFYDPKQRVWYWNVRCDCGTEKVMRADTIKNPKVISCGCYVKEKNKNRKTTHGKSSSPTYNTWKRMRQSCQNPKHVKYYMYGGRGIKVCDRWNKFENFLKDMGEKPKGLSLGRIDNEGDYCSENCRWETRLQQQNNTRRNRYVTYQGKTQTVAEWARELNLDYNIAYKMLVGAP